MVPCRSHAQRVAHPTESPWSATGAPYSTRFSRRPIRFYPSASHVYEASMTRVLARSDISLLLDISGSIAVLLRPG